MIVVGVSALYHDAACAVLVDGELVAAAQEERFTRRRYEPAMPAQAMRACLRQGGLTIADVDRIAYYESPAARLSRQLWQGLPDLPSAAPHWFGRLDADRPYREIRELLGYDGPVMSVTHHEAHAASAFYCSGFAESALLTADAVGEWTTTSYGRGGPEGIELFEEVSFPHSLGLLYSAVTSYLGFDVNSDEYKVMGLAPYGRPTLVGRVETLVENLAGGQFRLDQSCFDFSTPDRMYRDALAQRIGAPPRARDEPVTQFHRDLARSVQHVLEEILLDKVRYLSRQTGSDNLSYAGGVALNCVANARIRRDGPFTAHFIQPAAGDAGGAIGAAAIVHHRETGTYTRRRLSDARLGPAYDTGELQRALDLAGVPYLSYRGREGDLVADVAAMIAAGKVVGWYQGRMEFGPRALGARSILADPRGRDTRDHLNALVKQREAFRPFAPAVAAERARDFFDLDVASPFMLDVAQVRDPDALPAVTHVDGSARLQTVDAAVNRRFHALLTAFGALTGYPILLNTSFNLRGEPIVCTPADALAGLVRCRLDALAVEDIVLRRADLPPDWHDIVDDVAPVRPGGIPTDVYSFV
ncbi:carbamoyltransferase [Micromonospora craterilacus]|uniref:Carbamoyltransferase n=1 Tax=Micromonospora craterilacus TaxID=1655439 RepID=A0A2W2EIG5_9ACTN|nr:carbamoyltransferase C-terminal domain-containing protein [Micromonospora craterilacus]PZG24116.1 carbamoyltransferase [Micromonospora craterilacus]